MPFLIDGYNLLWAVQKYGEGMETMEDIELCRILSIYLVSTGQHGEIIFDGTGPDEKQAFDYIKGLGVYFSGPDREADSVIEDKIKSDTAPRRLVVVSSDNRIRKAAHTRKASSIKSEIFWQEVIKAMNKKKKEPEPPGKRGGISEGETEQWIKFFKIK